jgi:Holliday junction DNA helicase RuvA
MIASLKGMAAVVGADHAVVDVGGVGYLVQASARTLAGLAAGSPCHLLVETQVREDAITLFGFGDPAERDWFRLLTGVQGVGGRVALAILSTLSADELARAIATEDRAMIARAPGVGARLAARLVTELKGKGLTGVSGTAGASLAPPGTVAGDARSALENLGFRPSDAARAVAAAETELGSGAPLDALIRAALKHARS